MNPCSNGVICGRFQPFHAGHLAYAIEATRRCQFLWIGITNPDPSTFALHTANPMRSLQSSNPFTFFERLLMVRQALSDAAVDIKRFAIVPFPIHSPGVIRSYVPISSVFFHAVYDEWGIAKQQLIEQSGL